MRSNICLSKQAKSKQLASEDSFIEMNSDVDSQDSEQTLDIYTQSESTSESNYSLENSEKRNDLSSMHANLLKKSLTRNENSNSNFNINVKNNFNISIVLN